MSVSSVIGNIGNNYKEDLETGKSLGNAYSKAEQNYNKAVKSGDRDKIAVAQQDLNRAEENYSSFMATKNKQHDLIMQLIQMLSR